MRISGKTVFFALAGAALLGGGAAAVVESNTPPARAAEAQAQPPAVPVSVAKVESRAIVPWVDFSGRLEAVDRVSLRPRVAGQVLSVSFREGGLVNKGDVLVRLDPAPFAAESDRASAALASAEARLAYTRRELDRAKKLSQTGNITQSEVDNRTNAFRDADAAVRGAKA
ncbi:MAG: efflux RND transporter periplasmic adaptor subunit, partial [Rhodospirillaceae bacterium]